MNSKDIVIKDGKITNRDTIEAYLFHNSASFNCAMRRARESNLSKEDSLLFAALAVFSVADSMLRTSLTAPVSVVMEKLNQYTIKD